MQKKSVNQQELIHIFKMLYSKTEYCTKKNTSFRGAKKKYQGRPYVSSKANIKLLKRTEMISTMFTNNNEIKLEMNNRKIREQYKHSNIK